MARVRGLGLAHNNIVTRPKIELSSIPCTKKAPILHRFTQGPHEKGGSSSGGVSSNRQESARTTPQFRSRSVLSHVHSQKEIRWLSACHRLKDTKSACSLPYIQDGERCQSEKSTKTGRMVDISRSNRCVSSYPDTSRFQEVSQNMYCRPSVAICSDVFRTKHSTPHIYEDVITSSCSLENSGNMYTSLPRRLADPCTKPARIRATHTICRQPTDEVGLDDQSTEVGPSSFSADYVSRYVHRLRSWFSSSNARKDR